MARKKILWLCSWYPNKMEPFNGDFIQRHAIAAALYNDIHVIHVAGDASGNTKSLENNSTQSPGLTEQLIYYPKPVSFFARMRNYSRWLSVYKKAIGDYILSNGTPDIIHIQVPMTAGLLMKKIPGKWRAPYVVTEHWTIYQPHSSVQYQQQSFLFKSMMRGIISNCRLLLPVSKNLGKLMNQQIIEKEFTVIENVANEKFFFYKEKKEGTAFRFIHVSNMSYQKNVEGIIRCFALAQQKDPALELVLVGNITESVKQTINSTGLLDKNIFLRGEINYEAVARELQEADALVMFSRFENSPCSIIEALCCGLPVLSTNVGGIAELINENNGLLIEEGDEQGLINSIQALHETIGQYDRKKIAEDARGKFSYNVIGKKLDEVYSNCATAPV